MNKHFLYPIVFIIYCIIIIIIVDIGVERNSPLLGVNDGRNKRDLARARKVRRPTTRGKSGGEREGDHGGRVEGGGATLSIGQSGDEVVSINSIQYSLS